VRIIGGIAARRTLKAPKGYDVRPTPDLVKQAVFNRLSDLVVDARVLELFAGSGALGLECLSRGAARVVSVEKSNRAAVMIRENVRALDLDSSKFELRSQDAFAGLKQLRIGGCKFNLVFADPPYGEKNVGRRSTSYAQQLLDNEDLPHLLAPQGVFILGHSKRDVLTLPSSWCETKPMKHGDSMMRFLSNANDASAGITS